MIHAHLVTLETVAEVYPQIVAEFDRELDTAFLQPNESVGGCRPVNLAIANLPSTKFSIDILSEVQAIHDLACRADTQHVRGAVPQGLIIDNGFVADELSDFGRQAGLEKVLESRGIYRHGAVRYQFNDSVVVFSTYRNDYSLWDAYVRQCSTATGRAAQQCGPDPYGPLGGTDWHDLLSEEGCAADDTSSTITEAHFQDLTGDGYPDPVLLIACTLSDDGIWEDVRVYDGRSPSDSPRLMQSFGDYFYSLRPYRMTLASDTLTVVSSPGPEDTGPTSELTDRFQWNGEAFVFLSREAVLD